MCEKKKCFVPSKTESEEQWELLRKNISYHCNIERSHITARTFQMFDQQPADVYVVCTDTTVMGQLDLSKRLYNSAIALRSALRLWWSVVVNRNVIYSPPRRVLRAMKHCSVLLTIIKIPMKAVRVWSIIIFLSFCVDFWRFKPRRFWVSWGEMC